MSPPPDGKPAGPPLSAVLGRGDLWASLLFIVPLFLIYEVGVAFAPPAMNGVDFVSRNLTALVGKSRSIYLLVHAALALVFIVVVLIMRRRRHPSVRKYLPMLLESGIYSLTLGTLIWLVMRKLLGFNPGLGAPDGPGSALTRVVLSFGAGVHEELVFRLGMCAGGAAICRALGLRHGAAVAVAFLASSALFSAAHHLGAAGDPWSLQVFVYRMLAGLVFAAIFYYRSLAHAAYTHALYDVYVTLIKGV